jgi:hypothetical protein
MSMLYDYLMAMTLACSTIGFFASLSDDEPVGIFLYAISCLICATVWISRGCIA